MPPLALKIALPAGTSVVTLIVPPSVVVPPLTVRLGMLPPPAVVNCPPETSTLARLRLLPAAKLAVPLLASVPETVRLLPEPAEADPAMVKAVVESVPPPKFK